MPCLKNEFLSLAVLIAACGLVGVFSNVKRLPRALITFRTASSSVFHSSAATTACA
jgi:hypothetical protein